MDNQATSIGVLGRLSQTVGFLFCLAWGGGIILFPLMKGNFLGYSPVVLGMLIAIPFCFSRIRERATRLVQRPGSVAFLVAVASLALILRLGAVAVLPGEPYSDAAMYHYGAVRLLNGEGYGDTAFFPPGMSMVLMAWYWLTTPQPLAGEILGVLMGTGMVLLVWSVGSRAISAVAGRWAALLVAVMPTLVLASAQLGYAVALGVLVLALCRFSIAARAGGGKGVSSAAACGLLLGLGVLIKPICLLLPGMLLVVWLAWGMKWRALVYSTIAAILMIALVAPWTIRNYRLFGEFVLVSTNGGVVLYNANNPDSVGIYMDVEPLRGETDEVSRDRIRRAAALRWITEHPGQWLRLAFNKIVYQWGTSTTFATFSFDHIDPTVADMLRAFINTAWTALCVLVSYATLKTAIWKNRLIWFGQFLVIYVFGLHLFFEAISRHHIPVMSFLVLMAAAGLASEGNERQIAVNLYPA